MPESTLGRAYFDYALNGILLADADGFIHDANPAACSITGLPRHKLVKMRLPTLFDTRTQEQRDGLAKHMALLGEQGISRAELRLADGAMTSSPRIVELASIDIGEARILHVFDDVTAQRELVSATEKARQAADEANRAKSSFLANISHEIRTPLNGIIGLAKLLELTSLSGTQAGYLGSLLSSSQGLLEILNDLLDFSKIEAGRIEFESAPFDLPALIEEVAAIFTPAAHEKGLRLSIELSADIPRYVAGDRLRLGQILRNLLGNAVKFTLQGGITLRVERNNPTESGTVDSQLQLRFCIEDTGIGMSQTELGRIFSPFAQADASTTRRFGGTGLGLAITRMLAEGLGGQIGVTSTPGRGSRFVVHLPFGKAPEPPAGASSEASAPFAANKMVQGEFAGARVLVAEDNAVNRLVIGDLLRHAGIEVALVENGRKALEALSAAATRADPGSDAAPDLILMDVQMPEMDGLTATRVLRERGVRQPIVALTAGVSRTEIEDCQTAGMNDFLGKPIDVDELVAVLTRWLPPRRAGASRAGEAAAGAAPVRSEQSDALPGIDLEDALPRFLGRLDTLRSARDAFLLQHADSAAQLAVLTAQQAWPQIGRIAHSIKGAAGNIGATTLHECAKRLEGALATQDAAAIAAAIGPLQLEIRRLAGT